MARLPPELVSLIFDFIEHDKDWTTLKNCSLISQYDYTQVFPRLFKVISLRLRSHPNPIVIRDVARRIEGLCDLFQRSPEASRCVKTFELLDSYPVYNSQWITQQRSLPRLLDMLHHTRQLTFGCEVGFLQWSLFTPELQNSLLSLFRSPVLKTLSLANVGSIPVSALNTCVHYLFLNNILTARPDPYLPTTGMWMEDTSALPDAELCYLNVRTVSKANTNATWGVMLMHADKIKLIKWRCWEDTQTTDGVSFPGQLDFGRLTALRKFSIRMSFGKLGRDLIGFSQALESVTRPSSMISLTIIILFPLHPDPHSARDLQTHTFWARLADVLSKPEYCSIRKLNMELTVHERMRMVHGTRINSVTEFREQIKQTLRPLLNMTSLHFKLKVKGFHHAAHE